MNIELTNEEANHLRTLITRRNSDLFDKERRLKMQLENVSDGGNPNYAAILTDELKAMRTEMQLHKVLADKVILAQIEAEMNPAN
jgi:hypothetical protein